MMPNAYTHGRSWLFPAFIGSIILVAIGACLLYPLLGIFPFGPSSTQVVTIQRTYVDISKIGNDTSSHYMVGTDLGVFEVDNSIWLWIWNADEIYAKMESDKKYKITTKGNKMVNFLMQQYPVVIKVEPVGDCK